MQRDTVFHVSSYPRSGNHLLRTILEYSYMRPTLGCPGNADDTPIHVREPNQKKDLIEIEDAKPIAVKSHFLREMKRHDNYFNCDGIILVVRDPIDSISSHIGRMRRDAALGLLDHLKFRLEIRKQIRKYRETVKMYKAFSERRRHMVYFQDLSGAEGAFLKAVDELYRFIGLPRKRIRADDILEIREVSKDSQDSISPDHKEFKNWVRRKLERKVSLDSFLNEMSQR